MFEEEQEPESLRKKWDEEDLRGLAPQKCEACGHDVAGDSFFCLFCGERVFEKSGPLGRLVFWTKRGGMIWVVVILLSSCFFLFSF